MKNECIYTDDEIVKINIDNFENRYKNGYGIKYPESHIIRFYNHILKDISNFKKPRMLDYGCGLGTHTSYFNDMGYEVYGCDTSETAIHQAKLLYPNIRDNFFVLSEDVDFKTYIKGEIDLVICSEVLSFLPDTYIEKLVKKLFDICSINAYIYCTFYPKENGIYQYTVKRIREMNEIELNGRLNHKEFINFKNKNEIITICEPYSKEFLGYVDMILDGEYGNAKQLIYVGKKLKTVL